MSGLHILAAIGLLIFHFATGGAFLPEDEATEPGALGFLFLGGLLYLICLHDDRRRLRAENRHLRAERKH